MKTEQTPKPDELAMSRRMPVCDHDECSLLKCGQPDELADTACSAAGQRHPDCAANGGPTISRARGCINDEMRECVVCGSACRWDMTDHAFFGFAASCPQPPNSEM